MTMTYQTENINKEKLQKQPNGNTGFEKQSNWKCIRNVHQQMWDEKKSVNYSKFHENL